MKRWLSLALAFALALGLVPASALAAGSMMNILPYIAVNTDWKYVGTFYDGYADVEMDDGTQGYIDPYGEFYAQKPEAPFDMSDFICSQQPIPMNRGDEFFFLDQHGNILLRGLEEANPFSDGVAAVKRDGVWYVVDANTIIQHVQLSETAYERVLKSDILEGSGAEREAVRAVYFENTLNHAPADAWDASAGANNKVRAYFANENELHIAAEGGVVAGVDLRGLFAGYSCLEEVHFAGCFDTSETRYVAGMFGGCAALNHADIETLDLSGALDADRIYDDMPEDQPEVTAEPVQPEITAEPVQPEVTAEPINEDDGQAAENNPFADIHLARGSRGEEVRLVQQCLIEMGYLNDVADGAYGNNTANAVMAYQRARGYAETGEVDGRLYLEFYNYMNAPAGEADEDARPGGVLMSDEAEYPGDMNADNADQVVYNQLAFNTGIRKADVTEIVFRDSLDGAPANSYDVSEAQNGSVRCWLDGGVFNIAANGTIYAPEDCGPMFWGYVNAHSIDFGNCFDTSRTTDMRGMFESCWALEELYLPEGFTTASVLDMTHMFMECHNLRRLSLPQGFTAVSAESLNGMFDGCGSLEALVLPDGFSVSSAYDLNYLFADCSSLRELVLPESFDSSSAESMVGMFDCCESLETLALPESFDTSAVTDMRWMFRNCRSLTYLDVSRFDVSRVQQYEGIFDGCDLLSLTWEDLAGGAQPAQPEIEPAAQMPDVGYRHIGILASGLSGSYSQLIVDGLLMRIGEYGWGYTLIDCENNPEIQLSAAEMLFEEGVDALVVDSFDMKSALILAEIYGSAGIPLFTYNSRPADMANIVAHTTADHSRAGYECGLDLVVKRPEGGKVLVLDSTLSQEMQERTNGFMDAIDGHGFEVISIDTLGNVEMAQQYCMLMIASGEELDAIFCNEEQCLSGVVQVAQELDLHDMGMEILIYGADATPDMKEYIADGTITGVGAVNPMNIGASVIEKCCLWIAGEEIEQVSTCQTILINADNVADFSVDGWQ